MKLALLTLVLASALAVVTRASNEDAETTLRAAVDQVLTVAEKAKSGSSMADQITPVLLRYVCFESMTRRAVGPGWRQFTPDQKAEATKLFTKLIIRSYSEKFTPGEQPDTKYLKSSSPGAGKVEIPTITVYKGSRYNVTYRMEDRGKWMVTDILAEGVSLVANYRAQFDALVKKGGAGAVIASLKQSVERT
ncbi:MAG: ABC transporter substrate-binding protein [Chthoniobacterales bacterium]|nr:ABC transporter substrate-binding protein [Chthoniobacterales bacterium]